MMEEALIGEPSPSHRATLELLRECHNASTGQIQAQRQEVHELRGIIERQGMDMKSYFQKMGQMDSLAQSHSTIARAIKEALANGNAVGLTSLQDKIGDFQRDLEQCADNTATSKNMLLKLLTRI
jgi:hypothetical protein